MARTLMSCTALSLASSFLKPARSGRKNAFWLVLCLLLLLSYSARGVAQIRVLPGISTVAGNGTQGYSGDGGPATAAEFDDPKYTAMDAAGDLYISDTDGSRIREVHAKTGIITTVTGDGTAGYSGDGGPATSAEIGDPGGIALDSHGNLYIADYANNRIREVNATTGIITTVAGDGTAGYSGVGGPATSAELYNPMAVAVDSVGNIYIADFINFRIREVHAATGIITTVAGDGTAGYSGDGGPATSAEINAVRGLTVDSAGNIYIADSGNNRVREVNAATGIITTVAGDGTTGYSGDGGPATSAELNSPNDVAVDSAGNIYIADDFNNRIREVNAATGIITTVAGDGTQGYSGDGGPATSAELYDPTGVLVSRMEDLYIADDNNVRIREVSPLNGSLTAHFQTTAIGNSAAPQNVYIELTAAQSVTSITAAKSEGDAQKFTVGTISGCTVDGSTVNAADTICTVPITFKPAYPGQRWVPLTVVTNTGTYKVGLEGIGTGPQVALTPGTISTVAGDGTQGYSGDGGAATSAELDNPFGGVAVDSSGNLYIADELNNRVREINAVTGIITTVAGDGTAGYNGDGEPATSAELNGPTAVAVDAAGNIYIADQNNNRVRKVNASTGLISTIDGGIQGDGTNELYSPDSVAVDSAGNVYIADSGNNRVQEWHAATGAVTTVAGTGTYGYSGDGGPATSAEINDPNGVAVDSAGNLYIADTGNERIREVNAVTGIITTVAGSGTQGYSGDGGPAASAELSIPESLAIDGAGDLYIADSNNYRVREVNAATGIITTVAGDGTAGYSGDGGSATSAELNVAFGLAVDGSGDLYISSDTSVREVNVRSVPTLTFTTPTGIGQTDTTDGAQAVAVTNTGNMPLTFTVPGSGSNPSYPAAFPVNSSATNLCSSTASPLAVGGSCNVSFNFVPTAAGTNTGSIVLTDNAENVSGATQSVSLSGTGLATPTITWAAPAAINYGTALSATQLDATGSVPGTFAYSPAAGAVLSPGTEVLSVTFTPTDTTEYGTATATVDLTVEQAGATVTWANPASITYGTALSSTQLDATASVPGTFVYSPASGTVLAGGTQTLSVTFTPTDTTDYKTTVTTVNLAVTQAPISVTVSSSLDPTVYGNEVDFTFDFIGESGMATPTGSATIMDGGATLGTVTLNSSGEASFTTGVLPAGSDTIKAVYSGDANYE